MSIYDPDNYPQGVPNPLGPRVHAWTGGPFDEGTRYHGAIWTRPQSEPAAWTPVPRWAPFLPGNSSLGGGCGCRGTGSSAEVPVTTPPVWKFLVAFCLVGAVLYGVTHIAGATAKGAG